MQRLYDLFDRVDVRVTNWMARYGILLLRISLGIVFFWFGALNFFPGLSPAQDLAARTISTLRFGFVPPTISLPILPASECLIELAFITAKFTCITVML